MSPSAIRAAERTLRDADRLQKLQYGYDDLSPYIEGGFAIAFDGLGKHNSDQYGELFKKTNWAWKTTD